MVEEVAQRPSRNPRGPRLELDHAGPSKRCGGFETGARAPSSTTGDTSTTAVPRLVGMAQTQLDGSVALVTGASSGIGEATAEALAGLGASVALVARRADRLEALAGRIRDAGGAALVVEADVTGREAAEQAVARTVEELGGLDVVINNAGVMLLGPMADAPVEEWEQMVQLNIMGAMYVARAALPHLLTSSQGDRGVSDLVNISSVAVAPGSTSDTRSPRPVNS